MFRFQERDNLVQQMEEFIGMLFLDVSELLSRSVPDEWSAAGLEKPVKGG